MLILKTFALQRAKFKKTQPLALARALVVARKKCHEQEKLIKMLTQNTSQEELRNLPEACYCCRELDRPCLRNISIKKPPVSKQGFGEGSQSSSTLPLIAPREVNQRLLEIPARADNVPKMDLSDWEITCTEFHPHKRKPAPPQGQQTQHACFNCGRVGHFLQNCL